MTPAVIPDADRVSSVFGVRFVVKNKDKDKDAGSPIKDVEDDSGKKKTRRKTKTRTKDTGSPITDVEDDGKRKYKTRQRRWIPDQGRA